MKNSQAGCSRSRPDQLERGYRALQRLFVLRRRCFVVYRTEEKYRLWQHSMFSSISAKNLTRRSVRWGHLRFFDMEQNLSHAKTLKNNWKPVN
jgi:hypothetical protein